MGLFLQEKKDFYMLEVTLIIFMGLTVETILGDKFQVPL
jgi:hypothetical protein